MTSVSVIIPTSLGREKTLHILLEALTRENPGYFELIVSDDGWQADKARRLAERWPRCNYVAGPGRGPAANRNFGAALARGDLLVFLDDDVVPTGGLLSAYEEAADANQAVDVFEGRTIADRKKRSLSDHAPVNEDGGHLWSCNFAIRRAVFERIEGFDEEYPQAAFEDVDLAYRLNLLCVRVLFVAQAEVVHPWRQMHGLGYFRSARAGEQRFVKKYPSQGSLLLSRRRYAFFGFHGLIKVWFPGLLEFRGRGAGWHLLQNLAYLRLALSTRRRRYAAKP